MNPIFFVAALAALSACQNAANDDKLKALEGDLKTCTNDLKAAEQGKRNAEARLAQLQSAASQASKPNLDEVAKELGVKPGEKLYATFVTSMGNLTAELFWEKAPNTVVNFVALAEGTKEWVDPKTKKSQKKPLYDGTIFHRVIPDFMIQGGDPLGTGTGGPGFRFADEFDPSLKHTGPGILSMANSGPNTNGSQFFITEKATPWLDRKHTIFGQVTDGLDLIPKITHVEKAEGGDKPKLDIVLKKVLIGRLTPKKP